MKMKTELTLKKLNIRKLWDRIKRELFINKPEQIPCSKDTARRRELLLLAQIFLTDYQTAANKENKLKAQIAYLKAMDFYFNQK